MLIVHGWLQNTTYRRNSLESLFYLVDTKYTCVLLPGSCWYKHNRAYTVSYTVSIIDRINSIGFRLWDSAVPGRQYMHGKIRRTWHTGIWRLCHSSTCNNYIILHCFRSNKALKGTSVYTKHSSSSYKVREQVHCYQTPWTACTFSGTHYPGTLYCSILGNAVRRVTL